MGGEDKQMKLNIEITTSEGTREMDDLRNFGIKKRHVTNEWRKRSEHRKSSEEEQEKKQLNWERCIES